MDKSDAWQAIAATAISAVLGAIYVKSNELDERQRTQHDLIVEKLNDAALQLKDLGHTVELQGRDFNDLVEKKVDALAKRLPAAKEARRTP